MENLLFLANLSSSVSELFNDLSKNYAVKLVLLTIHKLHKLSKQILLRERLFI